MYNLPYYKEKNPEVVREFIAKNPFAFLSGCDSENRPIATQVPLFIEVKGNREVLRGHLMKNTDHHMAFKHNPNALAVFTGSHAYVSGTWYSNPHIASTWNYMSVHVTGKIRFLDFDGLEEVLRKTTLHFEGYNSNSETIYDNLPPDFKQKVLGGIVAFEIVIENIDTVFKLSQDRDVESYNNIIKHLSEQGPSGKDIAREMEARKNEIFPDQNQANTF